MKKKAIFAVVLTLCIFMVLFAGISGAQNCPGEFPSVSVQEDRYDFGMIGEGIEAAHDFIFFNKGGAALILEPIQFS